MEGEEGEAPLLNNETKRENRVWESSSKQGKEIVFFSGASQSLGYVMLSVTLVWIRRIMGQDG